MKNRKHHNNRKSRKVGPVKAHQQQARDILRTVLTRYGLWESFSNGSIPTSTRQAVERALWERPFLPPAVVLSASAQRHQDAKMIENEAREITQEIPATVVPWMQPKDFWRYYPAIHLQLAALYSPLSSEGIRVYQMQLAIQNLVSVMKLAIQFHVCLPRSRIENGIFLPSYSVRVPPGEKVDQILVTLAHFPPESISVAIGGTTEAGYRAALMARDLPNSASPPWIDWETTSLPGLAATGRLRVYVLARVIRSMEEQLDIPGVRKLIQFILAEALRECRATPSGLNRWLVEVRFGPMKLGYLVAEYEEGKLLIKGFSLLSLAGMPEGDRLAQALLAQNRPVDSTSLGKLSSFADTDLGQDDQLVQLLDECGCGGLFAVKALFGDLAEATSIEERPMAVLSGFMEGHLRSRK